MLTSHWVAAVAAWLIAILAAVMGTTLNLKRRSTPPEERNRLGDDLR